MEGSTEKPGTVAGSRARERAGGTRTGRQEVATGRSSREQGAAAGSSSREQGAAAGSREQQHAAESSMIGPGVAVRGRVMLQGTAAGRNE